MSLTEELFAYLTDLVRAPPNAHQYGLTTRNALILFSGSTSAQEVPSLGPML